jgi:hyperosmotically inducible periplasmic protein
MIKKSSHVPLLTLFVGAGMLATVQLTASDMDERIEISARQSYIFRNYLEHNDLQITSRNGVVRLTGTVIDESHISLASAAVASLPGVVEVINQLTEQSDGPAEKTDTWLVDNVHSTLFFHQDGRADEITMVAVDGMVILGGMAGYATEKDLAGTFASDVRGVGMVSNNMTVVGEENVAH